MLLTWPIRARFSTQSGGRPCVEQTTKLKNSRSLSRRSPAVRPGAMPRRDREVLQCQTILTMWHGRQILNTAWVGLEKPLTGWRNSQSSPGAPQPWGWVQCHGEIGISSTPNNVANLARAPDFQHCSEQTKWQHCLDGTGETPNRLKKLPIKSRRSPAVRLGAMPRRDWDLFNTKQCCQSGTGARFSTLLRTN